MTLKKRLGAALAALTIGTAGLVGIASPAQAASSDCFSGKVCLWDDISFGGALYMYNGSTGCYTMVSQNNQASSLYNRTSRTVRFYDGSSCSGSYFSVASYTNVGHLDCLYQCANWNDRITSFKQV